MDAQAIYGGYAKNSLVDGYGKESMPIAKLPRDSHIFMPITYITPNYLSIFTIAIASSLTRLGNKVSLMLNDNNFIAHKYVLNNSAVMGYVSTGRYIQYVTDQMMRLVDAFGGDTKSVRIIKASDMWAKIMGDYGHFMSFYNLLGSLRVYGNEFENGEYEETYHILERPFNAYVYKNYADLTKSDFKKPEYLILSNKNPARYQKIIDMLSNKSANVTGSQVMATRRLPELQNNDTWPSCYMPQSAIRSLLKRINPKETDMKSISEIFIGPTLRLLESIGRMESTSIEPEGEDKTARFYSDICILLDTVTKLLESSASIQAADIKIASELQFKNVRKLLASKRVIEMLKYCDGEYTIAEMAKKANMQLSNASIYISRLREAGIVSADKKPRVLAGNIILPMELLMK